MHKREYGQEQPGIKLGMFVIRIPFIHYRWEVSEFLQALIMCATCLGAIPILTDVLKIPFELAWSMVIINGFLYTLHSTLGDPVVPGWITPSVPLTLVYLNAIPEGEQRIRAPYSPTNIGWNNICSNGVDWNSRKATWHSS